MRLPQSFYNSLSYAGVIIAVLCLFTMGFLMIIGWIFTETSSYLGLFIFIITPAFMIMGLLLIPIGMYFRSKKMKKEVDQPDRKKYPVLDLNIPRSRNAVLVFATGTLVLMLGTGLGSYEAFHYSESVEFCGKLCHSIMNPMYVAYHNSPHARVACVECHVGSGADWYVRSKLSGLRQVVATVTDNYETPIGHPILDLRPARETCEQCHWPEKFYTHQLWNDKTYLADSSNSEWNITMQIKTGPSHSALGLTEGIHWHINKNTKIDYIARDDSREDIPWVRYTDLETNQVTIFQNEEDPMSEEDIASAKVKTMDCIDCHNRPSHNYETPMKFIDDAITRGDIPKDLPYIKKVAMDIFLETFENADTAVATIKNYTYSYYKDEMPEVFTSRKNDIDKAVEGIISGFNKNIFPEMEASWDVYPNHIGHKTYNGCFRCHDGKHVSKDNEPVRRDCDLCHNIVKQGKPGEEVYSNLDIDMEFIHPTKIKGEEWREVNCSECHRYLY